MRALTILLVGLVSACGAAHRVPDVAARPPAPTRVLYRWHFAPTPEPRLWIEIQMAGEHDGTTQFGVPTSWGPAGELQRTVKDPRASNAAGEPLQVSAMEVLENPAGDLALWTVSHAPDEVITFAWDVVNDYAPRRKSSRNFYGPVVRDDVVHVIGHMLVVPAALPPNESDVRTEFTGFEELGWKVVSSFQSSGYAFEGHMRVDALRSAVFYAAPKLRVLTREVAGHPVDLALTGEYRFGDDELADVLQKIVALQRDFFDEHDVDHFLVTVLPNDDHINPDNAGALETGTLCLNGFATFMRPTASLTSASAGYRIKNLLTHEMLHHWIGPRIYMTPGMQTASWLHEGFTTYMSGKLLQRGDLIGGAEYVSHVNAFATAYQKSPLRSATNAEAAEAFWKGNEGHEIAYNRGAVLAAFLDRQMLKDSDGQRGLEVLLSEMVQISDASGPLDEAALIALVKKHTSAEFAAWFAERAIDGRPIELPTDLFGDGFVGKADADGIMVFSEAVKR